MLRHETDSAVYDKLFEKWVIPHKCACCEKCWIITDERGTPKITQDALGVERTHCVYGGPYKGYVNV